MKLWCPPAHPASSQLVAFGASEEDCREAMAEGETMDPHHHWCRRGRGGIQWQVSHVETNPELFHCPPPFSALSVTVLGDVKRYKLLYS